MEPSRSILYPRCRRAREAKSVHGSGCIIFYKWGFAWQTAAVRTRYYNSWGLNDDDGTSTSCVLFILWMHSVLHIRKVWKWNGEIDLENNNNNKAFLQFLCQIFSIWFKTPPIIGTIFPILDHCVHDAGQASLEKSGCCAIQMRGTRLC